MENLTKGSEALLAVSKIQEQLSALNRKLDIILSRIFQGSTHTSTPQPKQQSKPAYQAICADCKKECTIPFKPSGDRPVYCQECFARRKNGVAPKANIAPAIIAPEAKSKPVVKLTKKTAKKPAAKKKAVTKKKK